MTRSEEEDQDGRPAEKPSPRDQDQANQAREHANQAREHVNQAREEVNQARENANQVRENANQAREDDSQVREDLRGNDPTPSTATVPSNPQWVRDPGSQGYILIRSDTHCRVWPAFVTWSALVSHQGRTTTAQDFNTIDEACTWCEARIAERQAGT